MDSDSSRSSAPPFEIDGAAALALHGATAPLNFPDSAHRLPQSEQAARDISTTVPSSCICLDGGNVDVLADPSSWWSSLNGNDDWRKIDVEWVDEEAIYNMPLMVDNMAEGMLITPPAMKKGFPWTQEVDDDHIDLTLWGTN